MLLIAIGGLKMMMLSKDEVKYIVTEIADKVYSNSNIDLNIYKEIEPLISNIRHEFELIISESIDMLIELFENEDNLIQD